MRLFPSSSMPSQLLPCLISIPAMILAQHDTLLRRLLAMYHGFRDPPPSHPSISPAPHVGRLRLLHQATLNPQIPPSALSAFSVIKRYRAGLARTGRPLETRPGTSWAKVPPPPSERLCAINATRSHVRARMRHNHPRLELCWKRSSHGKDSSRPLSRAGIAVRSLLPFASP